MAVTAHQVRFYYPLNINSADGQAADEFTVEGGSDTLNLIDDALTQAADYWNGAIGRFEDDTTTAGLRGEYFHVKDFDADNDTLILFRPLSEAPQAGDTFRMFMGGNWRTTEEIPGLISTGISNVTGVAIDYVAHYNGVGDGTLYYDYDDDTLAWKEPGASAAGEAQDISAGDGTYVLPGEDPDKWIEVTVTDSSLAGSDQNDTITLTRGAGQVLPDWEGPETAGSGKTRYHLIVFKNENGTDDMVDARAFVLPDTAGTATQLAGAKDTGAGSVAVDDAGDWPTRSFWVYNITKDDVAYCTYRSGNTLNLLSRVGGLRGKTAAAWEENDDVEIYPEIDIGLDAPSTNQFENPANETTAPTATFSAPDTYADGLAIGTIAAGGIYGIWIRETILQGVYSRENYVNKVRVQWS